MLQKIILFLLILFAAYLLWDEVKGPSAQVSEIQEGIPQAFDSFYERFHNDLDFQLAHIRFPLPGRPAQMAELGLIADNFFWKKTDWVKHNNPYRDLEAVDVERIASPDGVIREWVWIKDTDLAIERHFKPSGDSWILIYYSALNPTTR